MASLVYADERFTWKTKTGTVVRVHWYEGSDAFGAAGARDRRGRHREVGGPARRHRGASRSTSSSTPTRTSFYDALGPATRENVGGQADAEIRTLFALIPPSQIDDAWVETVIPHELTHLVFDTAVHNPYHFPPRWLNEGLAVYESEGYPVRLPRPPSTDAARQSTLIPLAGLAGQFPTSEERFRLAYGESVSAVDFFVRTYGQDALVKLISSYADGRTDDEAFTAAIGVDVDGVRGRLAGRPEGGDAGPPGSASPRRPARCRPAGHPAPSPRPERECLPGRQPRADQPGRARCARVTHPAPWRWPSSSSLVVGRRRARALCAATTADGRRPQ